MARAFLTCGAGKKFIEATSVWPDEDYAFGLARFTFFGGFFAISTTSVAEILPKQSPERSAMRKQRQDLPWPIRLPMAPSAYGALQFPR